MQTEPVPSSSPPNEFDFRVFEAYSSYFSPLNVVMTLRRVHNVGIELYMSTTALLTVQNPSMARYSSFNLGRRTRILRRARCCIIS